MLEMVEARRNTDKVDHSVDLFSGLLDASQDELGSEAALSDDELIGGYSIIVIVRHVGHRLGHPPREHVYLSFCWTWGRIFLFLLRCFRQPVPFRPQRIHCASHLPCWPSIPMNKSACTNTSKALGPAALA